MRMEESFELRKDYLFVKARAAIVAPDVRQALLAIQQKARETGRTRILIDGMNFTPPRTDLERFLIGELFAELLGTPYKVAVFVPVEYINKLAENTAVNRGASLYITASETEALRWLLGDLPSS